MKKRFAAAIAALLGLCFVFAPASGQTTNPAIYGKLPDFVDVRLSPDGKTLAALQVINETGAVLFYDLDNPGSEPTGVGVGGTNARTIEWADNDHVLLLVSQSEKINTSSGLQTMEFFRWISASKSKGKATVLFGNEAGLFIGSAGSFLAAPADTAGKAIFMRHSSGGQAMRTTRGASRMKKNNSVVLSLFEVDLNKGREKRIETGDADTVDWIVNAGGDAVARIDYNDASNKREVYVRLPGESQFKLLRSFDEQDGQGSVISFWGLSNKPNTLLATVYGNGGRRSLVEFDMTSGEIGEVIFSNPSHDIDAIAYDPMTATVKAVQYTGNLPQTYHLSSDYRSIQKSLAKALPGAVPLITSRSTDGSRMIVEAVYTDHPRQYFLFDKNAKSLNMVAPSYQALDGRTVAKKEPYVYQTADGFTINGYLTAPSGASKHNMPLIVLPHGGPEGRDDQSFGWWEFFYASRGYLVYQPNFRGSDGYGFDFRSAGYGEWGRKMQDDITEGVRKLVAEGIADPNRICIVGASYGGYAALAGATLTPDLYVCAVSVNGVSNLPGMIGEVARSSSLAEDYWEVRIGNRFRDLKELNAVSPAKIAEKAGPPIMLIHSKDDVVVPIRQSRQMKGALERAGKSVEYVELDGEDHWLSTGEMRTEMLRRSIDFIDRYIGQ